MSTASRQTPQPVVLTSDALPSVRTILAALLWLSSRSGDKPGPESMRAMALQLQRLAVHPHASPGDLRAGLRLAGGACADLLLMVHTGCQEHPAHLH